MGVLPSCSASVAPGGWAEFARLHLPSGGALRSCVLRGRDGRVSVADTITAARGRISASEASHRRPRRGATPLSGLLLQLSAGRSPERLYVLVLRFVERARVGRRPGFPPPRRRFFSRHRSLPMTESSVRSLSRVPAVSSGHAAVSSLLDGGFWCAGDSGHAHGREGWEPKPVHRSAESGIPCALCPGRLPLERDRGAIKAAVEPVLARPPFCPEDASRQGSI